MLQNLPSLYLFKSMSKSSLNFIYKRAYAVINILKEWQCFMDLQHPTQRDSFKFYFLQSNRSWYDFVYIYCLKYYKNCAQFVSVYELCSKWSFICFNQCSLKVAFIKQSITNLDPHILPLKTEVWCCKQSLNHCAFMKRKLCRYWKYIAGVSCFLVFACL